MLGEPAVAAWVCGRLCARAPPLKTHTPHAPSPDPVSPPFARRCDCGPQLEAALQAVEDDGYGVVLYLRGQEGRGIGLGAKMHAYALQERGADTLDANTQLGLPVDSREYGTGAQILVSLGIRDMRLMSNNPKKFSGLAGYGLRITERVASKTIPNPNNIQYLRTKMERMGHMLDETILEGGDYNGASIYSSDLDIGE